MATPGISGLGAAAVRAADAMLNALGADEVIVVFPQLALPDDPSAQLGMVDPGVQQVPLSPIAVRSLNFSSSGPRRRLEFLISASAVATAIVTQNSPSADAFFDGALGLLYGSDLFHIVDVTIEYFASIPYLYKVTAVE